MSTTEGIQELIALDIEERTKREIGAQLSHQRRLLGYSGEYVAREAGIDPDWLVHIEQGMAREGYSTTIHVIARVAHVLGLELTLAVREQ